MENKIVVDVNEARDLEIKMYNLTGVDEKYQFYYDETNNIRKLWVTDDGALNIQLHELDKDFVLGGLVCNTGIDLHDEFVKLKKDLHLDKNSTEIKFRHISKGDFLDCLKSKKLNQVLEWLNINKLNVHYSNINVLYWSIVDIIDSLTQCDTNFNFEKIFKYKTILYELIRLCKAEFIQILYKYKYPNISRDQTNKFLNDLIALISNLNGASYCEDVQILTKWIGSVMPVEELVFCHENTNNILIDTFTVFYIRPIKMFKYSSHIFDDEVKVFEELQHIELCDIDVPLNNYACRKSNNDFMIQLSDIVVGIIGKFFEYLNKYELEKFCTDIESLNNTQLLNLKSLLNILVQSELFNKAFIHSIVPLTHIIKMQQVHDLTSLKNTINVLVQNNVERSN